MHSGSFAILTLGKAGQLAQILGACHDTPVFVDFALELDLVIHWTLLKLTLEFLARFQYERRDAGLAGHPAPRPREPALRSHVCFI